MKMKKGFTIKGQGNIEILIYGEIGMFGITAKDVIREIQAHGPVTSITLRLNSPGGEVFDGLAIFNYLNGLDTTIAVQIDGLAASIASVIAMAGDTITISENAMMMIHNPWAFAGGDADAMREMADVLEKVQENLVTIYERRTGKGRDEIQNLLTAETWFTAAEAVEAGLADSITEPMEIAAKFDLSCFPNCPECLKAKVEPEPITIPVKVKVEVGEQETKPCACGGNKPENKDPAPAPASSQEDIARGNEIRKLQINQLEEEINADTRWCSA